MVRTRSNTLALLVASLASCGQGGGEGVDPSLIRPVERGNLVITVRERGEIKAARDTRVSSELEGHATLIYLVPEGTVVAAGDRVAELDVSGIEEKRAQQGISVAKADATLEQARKAVEIAEKDLQAAARTAETRLQIARLRRDKFLGQQREPVAGEVETSAGTNEDMLDRLREVVAGESSESAARLVRLPDRVAGILGAAANRGLEMGEMANQILQQIDQIRLARADLELAAQTLHYSQRLEARGFITTNELQRDQINHERQLAARTLAWNDLLLLVNYTLPESLISLELEVENAELNLESVRAANDARRVREAAELKSIEAEHALALAQLETWDRQIQNGVLRAPAPGLVVYARMDWDEPVYEGMEVRERQEVILLPDVSSMMVELKIPEAQIGRLEVGQRAAIKVDAFPSRSLSGRVTHVSRLPDTGPGSQLLKVYQAHMLIDGDNGEGELRPGMNGTVTIEVGTLEDVLKVPLPALERRGDTHYVWRDTPQGPVAAVVELGANNLTHVQVLAGLADGDRIYLVRPPGSELPSDPEAATTPAQPAEIDAAGAGASRTSPDAGGVPQ